MENFCINYKLLNDKTNKKIVLLSDLHDYPGKRKSTLAEEVKEERPDFILIAGDNLQGPKYRSRESIEQFKYFLSDLSEDCPVVLDIGNHDLVGWDNESEKGYRSLEDARKGRVFPLINDSVVAGDVRVVGFTPSRKAYAPSGQESGNALLTFMSDWEKDGKAPSEDDRRFNILLCHNPKIVAQAMCVHEQRKLEIPKDQKERLERIARQIRNFDMTASGHLHNGYRKTKTIEENPSKYLDRGYWEMPVEKDINGHISFIRPHILKKTDMCRGVIYISQFPDRVIQLSDRKYFYLPTKDGEAIEIDEDKAIEIINTRNMKPIVISGGVNKFFNLPVDRCEYTTVRVLKKTR